MNSRANITYSFNRHLETEVKQRMGVIWSFVVSEAESVGPRHDTEMCPPQGHHTVAKERFLAITGLSSCSVRVLAVVTSLTGLVYIAYSHSATRTASWHKITSQIIR